MSLSDIPQCIELPVLWHCGIALLWYCGIVVFWYFGIVVLWYDHLRE